MEIGGIKITTVGERVVVKVEGSGERDFSVTETWTICQELGSAARQAQQHASQQQAAQAGVKTSAAPKIGRKPED